MDNLLQSELDDALFWAFPSTSAKDEWLDAAVWPMQCSPRVLLAYGFGDVVLCLLGRLRKTA